MKKHTEATNVPSRASVDVASAAESLAAARSRLAAASPSERTAAVRDHSRAEHTLMLSIRARMLAAVRCTGVHGAAEDVVQSKLARMSSITERPSARDLVREVEACAPGKACALVWRAGVNAAKDHMRHRRLEATPIEAAHEANAFERRCLDDRDAARHAEEDRLLFEGLDHLAPQERESIVLYYLERVPDEELVRRELGRPPGGPREARTVRLRIQQRRSRALASLKHIVRALARRERALPQALSAR